MTTSFAFAQSIARSRLATLNDMQPRFTGRAVPGARAWPMGLLLVATVIALWSGLVRDIGFAADGAHYFAVMVDGFGMKLAHWSRLHSNYAMQWPVWIAMRLGVNDLDTLKRLFDFGLVQYFVLSIGVCLLALRGRDRTLLLYPLLSFVLIVMPQGYDLFGEACFLAVIVWPVLFFILRPSLAPIDWLVMLACIGMFARSYETAPGAAVVLAYFASLRLGAATAVERWCWLGVIALLLAIAVFMAYWIIFPGSVDNRGWFSIGMAAAYFNACLLAALLSLALLIASCALDRPSLATAAFVVGVLTLIMPHLGIYAGAFVSFAGRSLTITMLPLLLIAAWLTAGTTWLGHREVVQASALGAVLAFGFAASWGGWYQYKARVEVALARHSGYVALADTGLLPDRYSWKWTMPTLSILWSPSCVGTVILGRPGDWQPYDPRERLPLIGHRAFRTDLFPVAAAAKPCAAGKRPD